MNDNSPAALFITWTVYGTFLPGDQRGWRHRTDGSRRPNSALQRWHADRLKHDIILLDSPMRTTVETAIHEICKYRSWTLWAASSRSNHTHVVATAPASPTIVRDQLKAKATRELRLAFPVWKDRPVWSSKGDIEFLDSQLDIEVCAAYVTEAQDRKHRET
ncbi:MAG: transposase [Planctomycetota bacterium]